MRDFSFGILHTNHKSLDETQINKLYRLMFDVICNKPNFAGFSFYHPFKITNFEAYYLALFLKSSWIQQPKCPQIKAHIFSNKI